MTRAVYSHTTLNAIQYYINNVFFKSVGYAIGLLRFYFILKLDSFDNFDHVIRIIYWKTTTHNLRVNTISAVQRMET